MKIDSGKSTCVQGNLKIRIFEIFFCYNDRIFYL